MGTPAHGVVVVPALATPGEADMTSEWNVVHAPSEGELASQEIRAQTCPGCGANFVTEMQHQRQEIVLFGWPMTLLVCPNTTEFKLIRRC